MESSRLRSLNHLSEGALESALDKDIDFCSIGLVGCPLLGVSVKITKYTILSTKETNKIQVYPNNVYCY